jgi:hypothetical protein
LGGIKHPLNVDLLAEFTAEEVKEALESMGDLKAPGPDGMPTIFYKHFRGVLGQKITSEVLGC